MNPDLRLYDLLPALYRIRDTEQGLADLTPAEREALLSSGINIEDKVHGPLKSLLAIIADQMAVLEENLDQLHDDQFIETCAEWVVPYIGQLVGSRDLIQIPNAPTSQRSEVANTISYRRRKGTAAIVEQLARDITGWNANVIEYFEHLATTQYMNHLRPKNLSMTGLKKWEPLEFIGTPFDRTARTADVRSIAKGRGKYNIPNIGIFLWRLNSYTLGKTPAFKIDDRRYTFDPLGTSRSIFNHPEPETEITHLAERQNVPMPISRKILDRYLEEYYGVGKSILLFKDGLPVLGGVNTSPPASPPVLELRDLISICDLSDITDSMGNVIGWGHMPQHKIAIDPVLGRIAFPALEAPPTLVESNYYYAFSAEMGGGGYEREQTFTQVYDAILKVPSDFATIQAALDQLAIDLNVTNKNIGVVEIENNRVYEEDIVINVAQGKTIELRSVDKTRPVILSNTGIRIVAAMDTNVIINGILVKGGGIANGFGSALGSLSVVHCTLVPATTTMLGSPPYTTALPAVMINSADTVVSITKSIVGALRLGDSAVLTIKDSIVDAGATTYPAYSGVADMEPGGVLKAEKSTFIGKVHTRLMELASNCIFYAALAPQDTWDAPVKVQRLQQGCARFSWFPPGARIPRPYRCQPTALADLARVRPMFNSMEYGDPDYCQLSLNCAVEITRGASDESEMGAFHHLYTPQRIANLRIRLEEYLRFGLEAGIFFAS